MKTTNTNTTNNQTPIQWLCMKLSSKLGMPNGIEFYVEHQVEILEALEMEKERLEQFYDHGSYSLLGNGHGDTFEKYYNEIFKNK